jgi:hypothetical protein
MCVPSYRRFSSRYSSVQLLYKRRFQAVCLVLCIVLTPQKVNIIAWGRVDMLAKKYVLFHLPTSRETEHSLIATQRNIFLEHGINTSLRLWKCVVLQHLQTGLYITHYRLLFSSRHLCACKCTRSHTIASGVGMFVLSSAYSFRRIEP